MRNLSSRRINSRWLKVGLLLLGVPLLMGQLEDCLPDPDPKTNARPLAIDCVADGTQIYMPVDLMVAPDRSPVALAGGVFVDTTATVRVPAEMFCALANAPATQTDLHGGTLPIGFSGVREPGDLYALHSPPVNFPIENIDLAAACAGAYGSEILVDFGTVQTVPWAAEDWTMDFEIGQPPGLQILLKNIDMPGLPIPGPTVDLLGFCTPTDRSEPPNGTTDDPEDSPRLAADRDGKTGSTNRSRRRTTRSSSTCRGIALAIAAKTTTIARSTSATVWPTAGAPGRTSPTGPRASSTAFRACAVEVLV